MIKRCRDIQKAAKNAVFSLHREDGHERAKSLLEECEKVEFILDVFVHGALALLY